MVGPGSASEVDCDDAEAAAAALPPRGLRTLTGCGLPALSPSSPALVAARAPPRAPRAPRVFFFGVVSTSLLAAAAAAAVVSVSAATDGDPGAALAAFGRRPLGFFVGMLLAASAVCSLALVDASVVDAA